MQIGRTFLKHVPQLFFRFFLFVFFFLFTLMSDVPLFGEKWDQDPGVTFVA